MAMLKQQGLGLMRALLVLVGVSALCSIAVGTRRGNVSLDQKGHRHRHSGIAMAKVFLIIQLSYTTLSYKDLQGCNMCHMHGVFCAWLHHSTVNNAEIWLYWVFIKKYCTGLLLPEHILPVFLLPYRKALSIFLRILGLNISLQGLTVSIVHLYF